MTAAFRISLATTAALAVPWPLAAQSGGQVEPAMFEVLANLPARLGESSGIAVSRRQAGLLWTHNDSGDEAFLYVTNARGEDLGRYRVPGATNEDWEDLALGPCPHRPDASCLYIADTGDNLEQRSAVAIYIVPEPPAPPIRMRDAATRPAHRLVVTYPDRPHDVEALAVGPDGEISLITKGRKGIILRFRIPAALASRDSVRAMPAETLAVHAVPQVGRLVTGAAVSPDGALLVIRSYTALYWYRYAPDGGIEPMGVPCWLGRREPQGEAVDFLKGDTLILTTEAAFGRPASVARVRCPIQEESER